MASFLEKVMEWVTAINLAENDAIVICLRPGEGRFFPVDSWCILFMSGETESGSAGEQPDEG
jgi:hypothetical protein